MRQVASRYFETGFGRVCNRCTSAVPPQLVCSGCGRRFASVTEAAMAVAQYAIAAYESRRAATRRRHG